MEQTFILFRCRADIRDVPGRPEPASPGLIRTGAVMTIFDGLFLKWLKRNEIETFA